MAVMTLKATQHDTVKAQLEDILMHISWGDLSREYFELPEEIPVICEDGTMADALSTALFVLGEGKALNYWRTYKGFEMIMVTKNNRVICTSGLIEEFTLTNENYSVSYSE